METTEKLIEYYFQRKIQGIMDIPSIRKSLENQQFMDDEERNIILEQVIQKEAYYRRAMEHKRLARFVLYGGLTLVFIALCLFFYTIYSGKFPYSQFLYLSTCLIGLLALAGSIMVIRR